MTKNGQPLSFGRYLRSVRREKGIGLDQVTSETRIGIETLRLIEQEDLSALPAEVFVKGFLRSYAKAIGADGDRAVDGYLRSLAKLQKTEQSEADLTRLSDRFWPHLMMAAGILIVLIGVSIFVFSSLEQRATPPLPAPSSAPTESPPPAEVPEVTEAPAADPSQAPAREDAVEMPAPPAPPPPPAAPEAPLTVPAVPEPETPAPLKQVLEIAAVAETWMKIEIDGEQTKEVTLKPGDRLSLEASVGYELLIGNAGGIRMKLNGEPVPLEGSSGQVKSVTLP